VKKTYRWRKYITGCSGVLIKINYSAVAKVISHTPGRSK
jgi:hypothetical protein